MDHPDADALFAQVIDLAQVPVSGMARAAVRLHHDRVGVLKSARVIGPAVGVDRGHEFVAVLFFEQPGRQFTAGVVLMVTVTVAARAGYQYNLFLLMHLQPLELNVFELYCH